MNKKRSVLVSSTPHPERTQKLASLFEDMLSPIAEPSKLKVSTVLPLKTAPTNPSISVKTGAVRKRKAASKKGASPDTVAAGVLKELGVDPKEIGNNALSHSRNLYNMFPEPIILDSDTEENTTVALKPPKKSKQDSKVMKSSSTKNGEEKKRKESGPGISKKTRLTRPAADRKVKKHASSSYVTSISKELKTFSNTKPQTSIKQKQEIPRTTNKPSTCPSSTPSVALDDDDDDIFPIYQPGTSIYQSSNRNKIREHSRLYSVDLDEKYPIQWSGRGEKATGISEKVPVIEISDISKNKNEESKTNVIGAEKASSVPKHKGVSEEKALDYLQPTSSNDENINDSHVYPEKENIRVKKNKDIDENENNKGAIKPLKATRQRITSKKTALNDLKSKRSRDVKVHSNVFNGETESQVLIARFDKVVFKPNNACNGIVARCLKTDQNDVGYLEVTAGQLFNGQSANVTFVVIEGKAKVFHLGTEQILSTGDMIHIRADSGYQFESAEKGHVRFLYIKAH